MLRRGFKRTGRHVLSFVHDQYAVLFLSFGLGLKQFYLCTYLIDFRWYEHYRRCAFLGFVTATLIFVPLYFVKKRKILYAQALAIFIAVLLVIDTVYYLYFSSLPSVGVLYFAGQTGDVSTAVLPYVRWWLLLYFADIVLLALFQKKVQVFVEKQKEKFFVHKKYKWMPIMATTSFIIAALYVGLPNGMSQLGIVWNGGFDTLDNAKYYNVLMSQGIDLVRNIDQEMTRLSSDDQKVLRDWVKLNKPAQVTSDLFGAAKGKNVIIVQVESLAGFVIGQKINGKEITPTLNALSKTSRYFPNERFIIGAGHTSDTDFVVNSSYFPMDDASVFVRYGNSDFSGLPKKLVQNGYSANVYHAYKRDFWNRSQAFASLGYQKYYAQDNYPKGWNINMEGLNDGDFLSRTADYIKSQPKPSLSFIITLSSHAPFSVNKYTKGLGLKIDEYPAQVGGYLENINYVDNALGNFFDKLKNDGLYDDSLIIIYGDHTPVLPAFTAGSISFDPNSDQSLEVPLLVIIPNDASEKVYQNQGNHINIMPTIFDLLGVKTDQLMFGQSLFASGKNALRTCTNQMPVFYGKGCDAALNEERFGSLQIIKYNQFSNISDITSR